MPLLDFLKLTSAAEGERTRAAGGGGGGGGGGDSGVTGDPHYGKVLALIDAANTTTTYTHFDRNFIDVSTNSHTMSLDTGGTGVRASSLNPYFPPEGYNSVYYSPSNIKWQTVPSDTSFKFGSGDFTLECFVNITAFTTYGTFATDYNGTNDPNGAGTFFFRINNTTNQWQFQIGAGSGLSLTINSSTDLTVNTWHHIAVTRSGTSVQLWQDGVEVGSGTSSVDFNNTQTLYIGSTQTQYQYTGYISNFRIVKGTAVYTSAFTTPTSPLTDVSGTGLLCCQSKRYVDRSSNAHTVSPSSQDPLLNSYYPSSFQLDEGNDPTKYGGSYLLDSSTNYQFKTPGSAAFNYGTGDFTWEGWIRPNTLGTSYWLDHGSNGGMVQFYNGVIRYYPGASVGTFYSSGFGSTDQISLGAWHHLAVSRVSGTTYLFLDGKLKNSGTDSKDYNSNYVVTIGEYGGNIYPFDGYMADIRITKGAGLYTADFDLPTQKLTATSQTSLLLQPDLGIVEKTGKHSQFHNYGSTSVDNLTQHLQYASTFDGTGDWIQAPSGAYKEFGSGDFTIEAWVTPRTTSVATNYIVTAGSGTSTHYNFALQLSNKLRLWLSSNGSSWNLVTSDTTQGQGSTAVVAGQTYHVAMVRDGTNIKGYLNGNLEVTVSVGTNSVVSQSSENLNIGKSAYQGAYGYFNGDIYAVRVVKGTAVYTAAFAPPTTPLTAITNTGLLLSSSSSTVTDTSTNSHTLTVNGDTSSTREINNKETKTFDIDAAIDFKSNDYIKLGWGKGYIDGDASGTYTDTTDNNMSHNNGQIYNLQDKDFTIEFWFKRDAVTDATYADALLCNAVGIRAIAIGINPTGYTGVSYSTGTTWDGKLAADPGNTFGSIQIELGKWYHYAVVRDGNNGYQYVNGVRAESFTFSGSLSDWNGGVFLGHWHDGYSRLFNGKIAQLRFTKGVARYTNNTFNVPTSKFPENYGSASSSSGTTLATDAYFANTVFLQSANTLPANTSVNNNQTYTDSSTNGFSVTETGTVYTSSFSPYTPDNQWSRYFPGNAELRYTQALGFYPVPVNFLDTNQNRTGTYELWVWLDGTQPTPSYNYTHASFMAIGGSYLNFGVLNTGALRLYFYTGAGSGTNSQNIITTTDTLSPYQWHHIALVRNGTDLRFYIDGSLSLNTTFTGVNGWASGSDGQRLTIGRGYSVVNGGEYFKGYMADIRSSSTARYTGATYTVPTDFFTSDSDTNLLINMKKMGDKSSNDYAIDAYTVSYAKAFSPIVSSNTHVNPVSGSIRMDAGSSYLNVVNAAGNVQFGTGDFTVEGWIYFETTGSTNYACLMDTRAAATSDHWVLGIYNAKIDWFYGSRTGTVGTTSAERGEWNHLAVTKSGSDLRGFLNGELQFTLNASAHNYAYGSGQSANPIVGRLIDAGTANDWTGYVSDVRVVKGTALYTSAFTPPTAPLTAVTNTELLMNMNDYGYYDQANHLVLESSDETKSNAWPWGRHIKYASYHPNSNQGYYTVAETAADEFTFGTGDVTMELFYLPIANPSYQPYSDASLMTTAHGNDAQGVLIAQYGNTGLHLLVGAGSWSVNTTVAGVLTYGRWHHIAYSREGNVHRLYVNGDLKAQVTNAVSATNTNNLLAIGGRSAPGASQHSYGYIGDARVVKGTAVYTAATITPPFSGLTAITNTTFLQSTDSTTLVDTSASPLTITQQGGIGTYTNFKNNLQVATTPLSFDGGSYINIEEGDNIIGKFGTQDFTIEAYVWRQATGLYGSWLASDHSSGFNTGAIFFRFGSASANPTGNNNGKFHVGWHGVGDSFIVTTNTYADRTWHHYALVRSGNSFTQYVNGVRDGTATSSNEFNLNVSNGIRLGQSTWDAGNGYFNGMISQLRMTLGHARYSGAAFNLPDNYFPGKKP